MKNKNLISIITASSVGTMIEWYDFYIFGSLATVISTQFFPKENPTAAFLATLATYAAGLVARPFGALFFGRLGDLIGRKYTFMITLLLMGGSTFAIGLVPKYETIGFWAPVIILLVRLAQGLAIGGEYGGAATFVAEHSPVGRRGFWTSWIQITAIIAFVISLGVILIFKSLMAPAAWNDWGWRLPFLISVFMVGISVYIRKNMSESPLFARAKAAGKTSSNPLKESFGNKANFKFVLLALFGIVMGLGAVSWASVFYVQTFFIKFMFLDYDQTNTIIITGLMLGAGFSIFFGWLSDRVGRKSIIMLGLFLALICFRPIFQLMYQTTNLQHKTENKSLAKTDTNTEALIAPLMGSMMTTTTQRVYADGTATTEIEKEIIGAGDKQSPEISTTIKLSSAGKWKLILLIFILEVITTMTYGPLAAFLVEMFPLKIRYSSMSLPYHIGFGIFGGMCPVIATYLIEKAKLIDAGEYYLAGLNYPLVLMGITLLIGVLYLKEKIEVKSFISISAKKLNTIKRYAGIVWIGLGLAAAWLGIFKLGIPKLASGNRDDLIFGIIVLFIITPVASIGLFFFGKYALQGEYDDKLISDAIHAENNLIAVK
ncbi:MAG: MFS transporter [Ginsengibacter sp.]